MTRLEKTLSAWGKPDFEAVLKREIAELGVSRLPLQQGMSAGNHVPEQAISATILDVAEQENSIRIKAGIFFSSEIAGCSCADDPTPADRIAEYCKVLLDIDKTTAATTISLVTD